MTEKNGNKIINNNPESKTKLLMILTIILCVILFLWISYSFYGFWKEWKSPPKNVDTNSYIDKAGLSEVKSILEGRK